MYHYVYRLDSEDGLFYFGSRTSKVNPKNDPYMGSGVWPNECRRNGIKLVKTVLNADFKDRPSACRAEIELVCIHSANPRMMNRSKTVQVFGERQITVRNYWQEFVSTGIVELGHLHTLLYITLVGMDKGTGVSESFLSRFCSCSVEECHSCLESVSSITGENLPSIYREGRVWFSIPE